MSASINTHTHVNIMVLLEAAKDLIICREKGGGTSHSMCGCTDETRRDKMSCEVEFKKKKEREIERWCTVGAVQTQTSNSMTKGVKTCSRRKSVMYL